MEPTLVTIPHMNFNKVSLRRILYSFFFLLHSPVVFLSFFYSNEVGICTYVNQGIVLFEMFTRSSSAEFTDLARSTSHH